MAAADRPPMHPGQVAVPAELLAQEVARQFPDLAGAPVRALDSAGTVIAPYRIGEPGVPRPLVREHGQQERDRVQQEARSARQPAEHTNPVLRPGPAHTGRPARRSMRQRMKAVQHE